MSINWNNIRAIEGQREGFEELICQLAGQEKINDQMKFFRIGKPDAGKECYWELNNGNIHCWQAKYFTNSLSDSQWTQIDKSVRTAIDHHPTLIKYYVAIPVDRPDGKSRGKSMLQKWKDHVTLWKKYASSKKMEVNFEYWGKHELETRLRKPENEGLIYYFFNERELSDSWFDLKNQESIDALGGRYTPEINFSLPFLNFHNGFTRDQKFTFQINGYYETILEKHRRIHLRSKKEDLEKEITLIDSAVSTFRNVYERTSFSGISNIPYEDLKIELDNIKELVYEISEKLYGWQKEVEDDKERKGEKIDYNARAFSGELHELHKLSIALDDFHDFLGSEVCILANKPFLVLVGPAGIGKSHALADIVTERQRNSMTSLFLLGENFSTNEMPWTQILRNQLRFVGNEDAFLGAVNAKAESQQSRILFIIDALNEGNGRYIWPKKLKSFIRTFEKYPWLGLIVSIRDSFEDLVAPEKDLDSVATRLYHPGFESLEYEASIHFFKHFQITPPGSPLLRPEFQNPLFLKLFCEGLYRKGLNQIPDGYQGITAIIDNYIEGVEEKLAQPDQLHYDIKLKLLQKAIKEILLRMIEEENDHISYLIGDEIVSKVFEGKCSSIDKQYLKCLISEGIINEDLYWKNQHHYEGIHFAYQRFQDHLIISALLDKYFDSNYPEKSFESGPLRALLKDENEVIFNRHFLEALSIQIPERINKELYEVVPDLAYYNATAIAFINSLIWRRKDTIGDNSLKYVNEVIVKNETLFHRFLDMSISMALKPDFYFNADRLHHNLYNKSLAERDAFWTTWLQNKYGENSSHNSVKRLIDWAWSEYPKEEIDEESIRLAAIMLAWFLSSSNRYLRDASTKALVSLLQNRISVLQKVLQQFENINDPYIYERLYAVAYGCTLGTKNHHSIISLSKYIYKIVFDEKYVYPHILLRDYARGVIEYAISLNLKLSININKIRPPYKSKLPSNLPTIEEIDSKYKPEDNDGIYGGIKWGATAILHSMTTEYGRGGGYGDFGRYVFQSALSNWDVNYDALSNYAIQRIFELGYDPEIFTNFDLQQGSGRSSGNLERIGKKYQWLAFYEILAVVSDNCNLIDESSNPWSKNKQFSEYEGPWNPYVRDIDPTILLKSISSNNYINKIEKEPWWVNQNYKSWEGDFESWKKKSSDFPEIIDLLTVKDSNEVEWINLAETIEWEEPKKVGEDKFSAKGKRIWYDIGSWLVTKKELSKILREKEAENSWKYWFPSVPTRYQVFSREFYWSPASIFFQANQYAGGDSMPRQLENRKSGKIIAEAFHTALNFHWEEEYDCSKVSNISYFKPSVFIALRLKQSDREGEYLNVKNELVCFDPSVYEEGPSCLLIRKDHLINFLKESELNLIWIVRGEKQILTNDFKNAPNFDNQIAGLYYLDQKGEIQGESQIFFTNYDKEQ
ncbi:hypothetical protein SAMN05661096_01287 [Marivirga sericea]|uniref:ATP-binding protein n=1 Tax=Marivirga sericea TaxID=1028 RepID=A0A1X7J5K9_9BACT|nr:hypothetical protein [Marivirga sericea]RUA29123.1 MAG: ATP-binding protein [Bacteroidota bacterium]SMG22660.1 hypothetical protein SAMN05661096_01287 [Marivirga sericea]